MAAALLAWVALGLWQGRLGEAAIHAVLTLGALLLPWLRAPRRATVTHAAALLGLAALGAFSPTLFGYGRWLDLRLESWENLAHAALGAWGAFVAANVDD